MNYRLRTSSMNYRLQSNVFKERKAVTYCTQSPAHLLTYMYTLLSWPPPPSHLPTHTESEEALYCTGGKGYTCTCTLYIAEPNVHV